MRVGVIKGRQIVEAPMRGMIPNGILAQVFGFSSGQTV